VVNLSPVNKILGVFFAMIKMLYILSILIILLETYDERGAFIPENVKEESLFYEPVKTTASATIPAIEESTIWLKNNVNNTFFDESTAPANGLDVSLENLQEAKHTADSLGISVDDLKQLKAKHDSIKNNEAVSE